MEPSPQKESPGRRVLGLPTAAALVVASMVGSGVFTSSGYALADLGDRRYVLLAWIVGGVMAVCGALCYGALLRRMPESGGEYHYLARMVHPMAGFLAGWVSLLAGFTAPIAVAALAIAQYLSPLTGWTWPPAWTATGAILLAFCMHALHLGRGVRLHNSTVLLKLALLAAFLLMGFLSVGAAELHEDPAPPDDFDLAAFAVSLIWIGFAYSGWNATAYIAGELRHPVRDGPRSLWLGCAFVVLLYVALNAVFLYSAPIEDLAGQAEVGAIAAKALGGRGLEWLLGSAVSLALFTTVSSMILLGPRVYARMAEDGLFPRLFKPQGQLPFAAILLQTLLAILVVWLGDLRSLLSYVGFTLGLCSAATILALLHQRHKHGTQAFPIPLYPFTPILYLLMTLGASTFLALREPTQALLGLATVLVALPLYPLLHRTRS